MAMQKKSLVGKRQSAKKALVAKRVSADTPKAAQVKAPFRYGTKVESAFRFKVGR